MRGPRPCANSIQGYEAAVIGDVIAITVFAFTDRLRRPHRITCPAGGQTADSGRALLVSRYRRSYPFAARTRRNVGTKETLGACTHKIAIRDSVLINVRFGLTLRTQVGDHPRSDKCHKRL